jgi:D-alanine-D-alanine ligase
LEDFTKAVNQCLFEMIITRKEWEKLTDRQKRNIMEKISNLDEGIGFPVLLNDKIIYHPADLQEELDNFLSLWDSVTLISSNAEDYILLEEFITGQEFSCGVIQDDNGTAIALPPTEIYGEIQTFDFKSKYKSNATRKRIPVETSIENLRKIHEDCQKMFKELGFSVVSRIDGFVTPDDKILLHDPNTIPGMSPASLIFKQMAEIGLNVSQSITYLIRQSIRERIRTGKNTVIYRQLLVDLDEKIAERIAIKRKKVAVVFGETDEQYEAAKKKFNELAASTSFEPFAVCSANNGAMYKIPLNLLTKQDIEDFGKNVAMQKHEFIVETMEKAKNITARYAGNFDTKVKKISEVDLAEMANYIFYAESGEMVEL